MNKKRIIYCLVVLLSCCLLFVSCRNGVNNPSQQQEEISIKTPEDDISPVLSFSTAYEVISYISKNCNFLEFNYDFEDEICYTNLVDDLRIVFDTSNAVIIGDYIKLPFSFNFNNKAYKNYCMYKIQPSDSGTLLSFDDYFYENWE